MKKIYLTTFIVLSTLAGMGQTTCISNGGNNWATAFNCTGSGTPVVYEIQAGDSVHCDITTGTMIDSMIIKGALSFEPTKKIDMNTGGVIQVYSGGKVTGGNGWSKFRFAARANLSGPFNLTGEAWSTGNVWIMGELPVHFIDMTASRIDDDVRVNWSTAMELNNSHFEVQVSSDQENWVSKTTVASQADNGNSHEVLEYETTLNIPAANGAIYVRVKQVDFDGAFDYSEVKRVESAEENAIAIEQMGNLKISVRYEDPTATISLLDINGKTVMSASNDNEKVELEAKSAGIYMVEIKTDRAVEYKKVVIQ